MTEGTVRVPHTAPAFRAMMMEGLIGGYRIFGELRRRG
jgi:hypothetical protein